MCIRDSYKNQKVKLFTDSNEKEAFYYDEAGTVNLKVERDSSGAVTGVSVMSEKEAQKCRAKFFEEDTDGSNQEPLENGKKYEQYASFGISFRAEEDAMYFKMCIRDSHIPDYHGPSANSNRETGRVSAVLWGDRLGYHLEGGYEYFTRPGIR